MTVKEFVDKAHLECAQEIVGGVMSADTLEHLVAKRLGVIWFAQLSLF